MTELAPGDNRHPPIGDNHIDGKVDKHSQCGLPIGRASYFKSVGDTDGGPRGKRVHIIVYQQHARHENLSRSGNSWQLRAAQSTHMREFVRAAYRASRR